MRAYNARVQQGQRLEERPSQIGGFGERESPQRFSSTCSRESLKDFEQRINSQDRSHFEGDYSGDGISEDLEGWTDSAPPSLVLFLSLSSLLSYPCPLSCFLPTPAGRYLSS